MPTKRLIIDLAKLVVATGWVDGHLSESEKNVLKDLIYSWNDVSEEVWEELEVYMDHPVTDREREHLLDNLLQSIATGSDKKLVLRTLRKLVEADGKVTREEQEVLRSIEESVEKRGTGMGAILRKLVGGAVRPRPDRVRENRAEDFSGNRIYFHLKTEMEERGMNSAAAEERLRKASLGAGLLAAVAWVDNDISRAERETLRSTIVSNWEVEPEVAELLSELSIRQVQGGLDFFSQTRSFFELTRQEERRSLLFSLFKLANAFGKTSFEEIEEIRRIAKALKLPHRIFIEAKLSISPEDRAGL